jgi:hypothetical protein
VTARQLVADNPSDRSPYRLADVFCRHARRRIEERLRALFRNDDSVTYKLARGVMEGRFTWLEEGVVSLKESPSTIPAAEPVEVS